MITKQKLNLYQILGLEKLNSLFLKRLGRILFYSSVCYIIFLVSNVLLSSFFGFSLFVNFVSDLGSIKISSAILQSNSINFFFFICFPSIFHIALIFPFYISTHFGCKLKKNQR